MNLRRLAREVVKAVEGALLDVLRTRLGVKEVYVGRRVIYERCYEDDRDV